MRINFCGSNAFMAKNLLERLNINMPIFVMRAAVVRRSLCAGKPSGLMPAAMICFLTAFSIERIVNLLLFLRDK